MGRLLRDRWSTIRPNMDLEGIRDDMTYLGAGQSFATNKANEWL